MLENYNTNISQSTISRTLTQKHVRKLRRGKPTGRPRKLSDRTARYIAYVVRKGWRTRRLTYSQLIKEYIKEDISRQTLGRALRRLGYIRCIACKRAFITEKQALSRIDWADTFQNSTLDGLWAKVIWTDECSFMAGERGRIWITRRHRERFHKHCIQSVYRSGRTSVMVWGAIGWGWKSKLIFLEKGESRGIDSYDYADQVLTYLKHALADAFGDEEVILMEDGAPVHKGYANRVRDICGFHTFYKKWPASSPDLNAIEKVWRWMKDRLTKMEPFPTSIDDLKEAIQALWDELDPCAWILKEIEKMPAKLQAVINARGYATKY